MIPSHINFNSLFILGRAQVQVLPCREKWCGVTYREDREDVKNELQSKKDKGIYPDKLWK